MTSILLAAALSLTSTNDYVYFTSFPTNADIRGIGMGSDGMYSIPRLEDAAFLTEAWTERADALGRSHVIHSTGDTTSIPRPMGFSPFRMSTAYESNGVSTLNYLFPESFNHEYWYLSRGENHSFVSDSFDLASSERGFAECETDWTISGIEESKSDRLNESYVCYIREGYRRLVPPDISTNRGTHSGSALRKSDITALYSNLVYTGTIVSKASPGVTTVGSTGKKHTFVHTSGYNYNFRYSTYEFGGRTYDYATSYSLTPTSRNYETDTDETPPYASSMFYFYKSTSIPYSTRATGSRYGESWTLAAVMNPDLPTVSRQGSYSCQYTPVRCYCPVLTTGNVERCSSIKAYMTFGIELKVSDYSISGSSRISSVTTNCCFGSRRLDLTVSGDTVSDSFGVHPVFDTDTILSDEIDNAKTFLGEPDYDTFDVPTLYPDRNDIPTSGTGYPSSYTFISWQRTVRRDIAIKWIVIYFIFNRDYRAKVID